MQRAAVRATAAGAWRAGGRAVQVVMAVEALPRQEVTAEARVVTVVVKVAYLNMVLRGLHSGLPPPQAPALRSLAGGWQQALAMVPDLQLLCTDNRNGSEHHG